MFGIIVPVRYLTDMGLYGLSGTWIEAILFLGMWSVLLVKLVGAFPWTIVRISFLSIKVYGSICRWFSVDLTSPFTVLQSLEKLHLWVSVCTLDPLCSFDFEQVYSFHGLHALFWGPLDVSSVFRKLYCFPGKIGNHYFNSFLWDMTASRCIYGFP